MYLDINDFVKMDFMKLQAKELSITEMKNLNGGVPPALLVGGGV